MIADIYGEKRNIASILIIELMTKIKLYIVLLLFGCWAATGL
jgi:hypothetical protein